MSSTKWTDSLSTQHVIKQRLMAKKDPAAVKLGRRGGQEYARKHTAEERRAQARKAAQARWAKEKKAKGARE
jgi:hypothetical protein